MGPDRLRKGKARIAVLISGRGSNLAALIDAAKAPDFPGEIALVIANKAALGLEHARQAGIACDIVMSKPFGPDRQGYDAALQARLDEAGIDLVCLAGFMRLFSPEFCAHWFGRMINVHPSLLPSFKGLDTHRRALEAGVKLHGCTTHFVTADMDEGPIIAQAAVPVRDEDDAESLAARVLAEEHRIFPQSLALLAAGRLTIEGQRVRIAK